MGEKHGAEFAPHKYKLIHLTRRPKSFNMNAKVKIRNREIAPSKAIRILGVIVDSQLSFKEHINHILSKLGQQTQALTRITISTWGAGIVKARRLLTMIVLPLVRYAAPIWHIPAGCQNHRKTALQKIRTHINKCMRVVTGAYRATSIEVLEEEAAIPHLDLILDRAILKGRDTDETVGRPGM